jgi:hypothetical protein
MHDIRPAHTVGVGVEEEMHLLVLAVCGRAANESTQRVLGLGTEMSVICNAVNNSMLLYRYVGKSLKVGNWNIVADTSLTETQHNRGDGDSRAAAHTKAESAKLMSMKGSMWLSPLRLGMTVAGTVQYTLPRNACSLPICAFDGG